MAHMKKKSNFNWISWPNSKALLLNYASNMNEIEKNECIDCISSEMSKRKGTRGRSDENRKS